MDQQMEELMAERYERLLDAFAELLEKGVSSNTISTLIFETGLKADDLEELHHALDRI
jgi:hypothetical protein